MRQGNDVGTQYRSGIYVYTPEQRRQAEASRDAYQRLLSKAGYGTITTEILDAPEFYYAEDYHQQYLAKNPGGYCGLGGTGVAWAMPCARPPCTCPATRMGLMRTPQSSTEMKSRTVIRPVSRSASTTATCAPNG